MPENQIDGTWVAGEVANKPIIIKHDDEQVIYAFMPDGTYRKSSDQAASWGARTSIFTRDAERISVWYGQSNYDSPTELIYVIGLVNSVAPRAQAWFRTIDPSNGDALGAEVIIDAAVGASGDWDNFGWSGVASAVVGAGGWCGIVRASDGALYTGGEDDRGPAATFMERSDDGGATWSAVSPIHETPNLPDRWWMFPDLYGAVGDLVAVYQDNSSRVWTVKRYAESLDSWSESGAFKALGGVAQNEDLHTMSVTWDPRTGDLYMCLTPVNGLSTYFTAGPVDIEVWKWSDGVITQLTNARSGATDIHVGLEICRDDGGRLHVFTVDGVDVAATNDLHYHSSDDDGATWNDQGVIGDTQVLRSSGFFGHNAYPAQTIVFPPYKDSTGDNDFNWQVIIEALAAPAPGPEPTPPVTAAVSLLCDHLYEFEEIIDPAGNAFNLTEGIRRHMLSEDGQGMPPIRYITQRAPFQHGETLIDFQLEPRVVQKVIRVNAGSRDAWWSTRNKLMDVLRPNRQVSPGQPVQALILRQHLSDGGHRDLHVMVDASPTMPQRGRRGWDEWSIQDVIRFIAHDPVWFDPTEVVVLLTEEENQLTFSGPAFVGGVDFEPGERIYFGGGLSGSVNYIGTWEAFPVIVLTGPVTNPTISNDATQKRLALTYDVAVGEQITFDLTPGVKTVVSGTAGSLTGSLDPTGDLADWSIVPAPTAQGGLNEIRLSGADIDVDAGTGLRISYKTRYIGI